MKLPVAAIATVLGLVLGLSGCADPSVAACEGTCAKRAECLGDVDVDTCRQACASGDGPVGDDDCRATDAAYQGCLQRQTCDDFAASRGCDAEQTAVTEACAPE